MRFWWVNRNQTYKQEKAGGYLWSPKVRKNGTRNPFYEFMREVSPGDLVFSFADTRIRAFGIARSYACGALKPTRPPHVSISPQNPFSCQAVGRVVKATVLRNKV